MSELEKKYPSLVKMVEYGKAVNGTPLYALRITDNVSKDSLKKPAVLFTGLIHAREWATGRVTMQTAVNLLEGYGKNLELTRFIKQTEIWFIPVVNPEGYDYSRTIDSFWRKNRAVIYQNAGIGKDSEQKQKVIGFGVDLNRNFWDPKHQEIFRISAGSSSAKIVSGASDNPKDEDYRGPYGASEPEIKALQNFIADHKNLIGIIDHHSYGNEILYPWGYTKEKTENVREYLEAGRALKKTGGANFKLHQSIGLYPTTGSSEDYEQANGIFNFTVEIGTCFHSSERELDKLLLQIPKMNEAFIRWVLEHKLELMDRRSLASACNRHSF
jgi:murein tripeptide amidase MpaA